MVPGDWKDGREIVLMPGTCAMQRAFIEHLLCARICEHSLQGVCTHTGVIIQGRFMTDQWEEGTW